MNSRKYPPNGLIAKWCSLSQRRSWRQDKKLSHSRGEKNKKWRRKR